MQIPLKFSLVQSPTVTWPLLLDDSLIVCCQISFHTGGPGGFQSGVEPCPAGNIPQISSILEKVLPLR